MSVVRRSFEFDYFAFTSWLHTNIHMIVDSLIMLFLTLKKSLFQSKMEQWVTEESTINNQHLGSEHYVSSVREWWVLHVFVLEPTRGFMRDKINPVLYSWELKWKTKYESNKLDTVMGRVVAELFRDQMFWNWKVYGQFQWLHSIVSVFVRVLSRSINPERSSCIPPSNMTCLSVSGNNLIFVLEW